MGKCPPLIQWATAKMVVPHDTIIGQQSPFLWLYKWGVAKIENSVSQKGESWSFEQIYINLPFKKNTQVEARWHPPKIWWKGILKGYDLVTFIASVKSMSPWIFLVLNKSRFCLFCSQIISMMFNQDGGLVISKKRKIVREWMWPSKGKLDDPVDIWVLFYNLSFLYLFLMPYQ